MVLVGSSAGDAGILGAGAARRKKHAAAAGFSARGARAENSVTRCGACGAVTGGANSSGEN